MVSYIVIKFLELQLFEGTGGETLTILLAFITLKRSKSLILALCKCAKIKNFINKGNITTAQSLHEK